MTYDSSHLKESSTNQNLLQKLGLKKKTSFAKSIKKLLMEQKRNDPCPKKPPPKKLIQSKYQIVLTFKIVLKCPFFITLGLPCLFIIIETCFNIIFCKICTNLNLVYTLIQCTFFFSPIKYVKLRFHCSLSRVSYDSP